MNNVIMSGVQTLVVKSDQQVSIVDVKNSLREKCLCRFQLTTNRIEKGSWFMSNSECIIEELTMRCYN